MARWPTCSILVLAACGAKPGEPEPQAGAIELSQGPVGGTAQTRVAATFVGADSVLGAAAGAVGPCEVYCPDDAPKNMISAGTISITGSAEPIMLLAAGSPVSYAAQTLLPNPAFTAGAMVTMAAAGDPHGVPMFSGTVTAPAALAGYMPPALIPRAGVTMSWTQVPGSTIEVTMLANGVGGVLVVCTIEDGGAFAMPTEVFGWLTQFTSVQLGVSRIARTQVDIPHGAVQVTASDGSSDGPIMLIP